MAVVPGVGIADSRQPMEFSELGERGRCSVETVFAELVPESRGFHS
jgi:hypothetical protein